MGGKIRTVKCPECGKRYELLSHKWAYQTKRTGRVKYFCSYTCWRADEKREAKPTQLRGEHVMDVLEGKANNHEALFAYLKAKSAAKKERRNQE